jgi:hypothetical protein
MAEFAAKEKILYNDYDIGIIALRDKEIQELHPRRSLQSKIEAIFATTST